MKTSYGCHKPSHATWLASHQQLRRYGIFSLTAQKEPALTTPWSWTSHTFLLRKPPSWWRFVATALSEGYVVERWAFTQTRFDVVFAPLHVTFLNFEVVVTGSFWVTIQFRIISTL